MLYSSLKKNVKLALVVDDSNIQSHILSVFLEDLGYRVVTSSDGAHAIDMYVEHQPDIILMNINMPVMNGFDAAKKIRSIQNDNFTSIIFVTADNTEQAFIDTVDADGDGFLVWPFSYDAFVAQLKCVQRKSDLLRKVNLLQQSQRQDAEIAETLLSKVIEAKNFGIDKIGIVKQPADIFSGDIHLTAQAPNGDINILLGDFTGHGLRSTIAAVPLSETFKVMTHKGFSPFEIISQVNRQLHSLLPTDLFLAATFVSLSTHHKTAYIFNAGLPDVYIFDERALIKRKVSSDHPPLGILSELLPDSKLTVVTVNEEDRILLISNGIIEARNSVGDMFDYSGFESAAMAGVKAGNVAQTVTQKIKIFCESSPQYDDISLIDIPCGGWEEVYIRHNTNSNSDSNAEDNDFSTQSPEWDWHLKLSAERLRSINPIPMIMNQISAIEGAAKQWQSLHIILTELFVNALDHGVLGLNSELKRSDKGFLKYFNEREEKLTNLESGFVEISLTYFNSSEGGKIMVTVKDSGPGFDIAGVTEKINNANSQKPAYSGRGLQLVTQLCDTVKFHENGSVVEAIYVCE